MDSQEGRAFNKLTISEKEIALADCGIKIKDIGDDELCSFVLKLVGQTHLNCGQTLDTFRLQETVDELYKDLKKYYSTLSMEEIKLAFTNGYKKEYGEYYGLNNATYFGWVGAYTNNEKRLKVKKIIAEAKIATKVEPVKSAEEIAYILKAACIKAFDEYRLGKYVVDAGNVKYNFLVSLGIINFSTERKAEILAATKVRLRHEAIANKERAETVEKALSKILDITIISEARKDALFVFFKELKESELELSDMMD